MFHFGKKRGELGGAGKLTDSVINVSHALHEGHQR